MSGTVESTSVLLENTRNRGVSSTQLGAVTVTAVALTDVIGTTWPREIVWPWICTWLTSCSSVPLKVMEVPAGPPAGDMAVIWGAAAARAADESTVALATASVAAPRRRRTERDIGTPGLRERDGRAPSVERSCAS